MLLQIYIIGIQKRDIFTIRSIITIVTSQIGIIYKSNIKNFNSWFQIILINKLFYLGYTILSAVIKNNNNLAFFICLSQDRPTRINYLIWPISRRYND